MKLKGDIMVELFNRTVNLKYVKMSHHAREDRQTRFNLVDKLDHEPTIDKAFIVDKGHRNGKEIHCVSKKGIIYILNLRKYLNNYNSLITVMVARPRQITRLYEACNLRASESIVKCSRENQKLGYNLV